MRILLTTTVNGNYKAVFERFDSRLFLALKPPGIRLNLLRFDGCKQGDFVHLELMPLGIKALKQEWVAYICENGESDEAVWFVDEGRNLPFFISSWRHTHSIRRLSEAQSEIVDDISFSSPLGWLAYPLMYVQFWLRKPIYRRYFS